MKTSLIAVSAAIACVALSPSASHAAGGVTSKTTYYSIPGANGMQLYLSMVKRGPRHGLLSRAIAQTSYRVAWDAQVEWANGVCRVTSARPTLSITYAYPKPTERISPQVKARWNRFMAGVRRHEETHGRLARQMVDAAYKSVRGLKIAGDTSCRKTQREMKRRANATYALYEARQVRFDEVEHRDGGNIDRLILALIKAK